MSRDGDSVAGRRWQEDSHIPKITLMNKNTVAAISVLMPLCLPVHMVVYT